MNERTYVVESSEEHINGLNFGVAGLSSKSVMDDLHLFLYIYFAVSELNLFTFNALDIRQTPRTDIFRYPLRPVNTQSLTVHCEYEFMNWKLSSFSCLYEGDEVAAGPIVVISHEFAFFVIPSIRDRSTVRFVFLFRR